MPRPHTHSPHIPILRRFFPAVSILHHRSSIVVDIFAFFIAHLLHLIVKHFSASFFVHFVIPYPILIVQLVPSHYYSDEAIRNLKQCTKLTVV